MTTAAIDTLVQRTAALLETCAVACFACAEQPAEHAGPKTVCRACAEVCEVTAQLLVRMPVRSEMLLAQVRAAYEATRTCAAECAQYDDPNDQGCAGMCSLTRDELKRLLATLEHATEPAPAVVQRDVPRVEVR